MKKLLKDLTEIEALAQNSPRREKIAEAVNKAKQLMKEIKENATKTTD